MLRMETISRKISLASTIGLYIAVALLGLLVMLVMAEIIRRAIWGSSFLFTFELSEWLMVGLVFMGLAYTLKTGAHVRVVLVTSHLKPKVQNLLEIVASGIGLSLIVYFAIHIFQGMLIAYRLGLRGTSVLQPPVYLIWGVAFIGLCLFSVQFIGVMFERIISSKGNR